MDRGRLCLLCLLCQVLQIKQIEKSVFHALLFNTYGGMGRDCYVRHSTEDYPNWYLKRGRCQQCDGTHQNPVEVCPVKKRSDSVERKEEWVRKTSSNSHP